MCVCAWLPRSDTRPVCWCSCPVCCAVCWAVRHSQGKDPLLHVFTLKEEKNGCPHGFSIAHYAGMSRGTPALFFRRASQNTPRHSRIIPCATGDVAYDVRGFLEKNKDPISTALTRCFAESSSTDVGRKLQFSSDAAAPSTNAAKGATRFRAVSNPLKRTSLGGQFKVQLTMLMSTLRKTDLHFIRCIKPNSVKAPKKVDARMTLDQLRCNATQRLAPKRTQNNHPGPGDFPSFLLACAHPSAGAHCVDRCRGPRDRRYP